MKNTWTVKSEYTPRPQARAEAWVHQITQSGQPWGLLVEGKIRYKTLFEPSCERHDDLDEVIIPLEGCYWVRVGSWARTLSPGQMAVIPRSTDHDSGIATNLPGIRYLVLLFDKRLNVLKDVSPGGCLMPKGSLFWLRGAFRYLRHQANSLGFLPLRILPEFVRASASHQRIEGDDGHPDPVVNKVIKLLEQPDTPSLSDLAGAIGLTPFHLQRRFLRATGCSPLQYAIAWRLDAIAKELDGSNSLPLVELATEYGFNDMKYFREVFYRRFDISPSAYRKNTPSKKSL